MLVSELMSPSKRRVKASHDTQNKTPSSYPTRQKDTTFERRDGLGAYIASPESFPSQVLYRNDPFVVINDLYPKSTVHLLIIPRHPLTLEHPIKAFEQDPTLLQTTREEADKVKKMVASELRRRFGRFSQKDTARLKAMEDAEEDTEGNLPSSESLPEGRDWQAEVLVGVHAGPSMNHLHVHVISRDRFSECMKHRKHYNSFATPFMIKLEEFPLEQGDIRRRPDHGGYLRDDLKCWRCGKNFRNRFQELKAHLDKEFEEWKRE